VNAPVLAVDVGGTKFAVALIAADGTILAQTLRSTPPDTDPDATYAPCADAIAEVLGTRDAVPETLDVGIGSAGPIDTRSGTVSPVNIAAWRGYPLVASVRDTLVGLGVREPRIRLAGDGHCIALGEHWLGAGRDVDTMVGMVISTGIGAGAVMNNRLLTGSTGNAVHIGHTSVNAFGEVCACGSVGCVEQYARGPKMVETALARGWAGGTDAKALCDAARGGDALAREVIDDAMRYLAAGVAACAIYLDIDFFVVGGGVSHAGDVIFEPLRRHLRRFTVLHFVRDLTVVPAELQNAGLVGAASLGLSLSGRGPLAAEPAS